MAEYTKEHGQVTLFSTGNAKVPYSGTMYVTKKGLEEMLRELEHHNVEEANIEVVSFLHGFTDKRGEARSVQNIVRSRKAKVDEKGVVTL